jgi:hypothetical protein
VIDWADIDSAWDSYADGNSVAVLDTVSFGRGGGMKMAKAPKTAVVPGAGGSAWTGFNGMIGGKRGFQPGNPGGPGRKKGSGAGGKGTGTRSQKASAKHRVARAAVSRHVSGGTLSTPEGRAAVKTAAAAHRELQQARMETAGEKAATTAIASGKATPLPAPGAPKPVHAATDASKAAHKMLVDRAATHLGDLHAGVAAGAFKPTDVHKHVERIARGANKEQLFEAVKELGIKHSATTKKALVEHLKERAHGISKGEIPGTIKSGGAKHEPVVVQHGKGPNNAEAIPARSPEHAAGEIERAHAKLNPSGNRVRIADLRDATPHLSREEFDAGLLHGATEGNMAAYRLDNPREIQARDKAAEFLTPAGDERHVVYVKQPHEPGYKSPGGKS